MQRYEALRTGVRLMGETEYLFVEAGGFDARRGPAWRPQLYVLKRK